MTDQTQAVMLNVVRLQVAPGLIRQKKFISALILAGCALAASPSELTNSRGERYHPGTPSWVPLIDDCMAAGGQRNPCIQALPADELEKLTAWEASGAAWRKDQLRVSRERGTFGVATNSAAQSFSLGAFRVTLGDDWRLSIDTTRQAYDGAELITIRRSQGAGTLRMQSYATPALVSEETLRNLTNVESSTPLTIKRWGDYSGYDHAYLEKGSYFKQWWLAHERTIVFITYQCRAEFKDIEAHEIDVIVHSLTANVRS